MTPVDLVHVASDLGADFLQIADNLPLHERRPAELDELAETAGRLGVGLQLGCDGAGEEVLDVYLGLAERLDAPLLRLLLSAEDLNLPREELASRLRRYGDVADQRGTRLAIENHFLLPSPALAAFVTEIDHRAVGVCLDLANSIVVGEWTEVTVAALAPHTVNLHAKDYRFEIDPQGSGFCAIGTPIGEGRVDVRGVLEALTRTGARADAVIEHWLPRALLERVSPREIEIAWTASSLDYLRRQLQLVFGDAS